MNTRRQWTQWLAAAGLSPAAFLQQALAAGSRPIQPGLRQIKGEVHINGRPAQAGQPVQAGDVVVTAAKSEALYVIGQDAFLQRANTQVEFPQSLAAFLRLLQGGLLAVFGQGEKTLVTSTASMGIRGTACYLDVSPLETYFCLCYGEALITPFAAPEKAELLRTRYHDHPLTIAQAATAKPLMAAAPVINHTDAELIMLEALMGRRPAFMDLPRPQGGY